MSRHPPLDDNRAEAAFIASTSGSNTSTLPFTSLTDLSQVSSADRERNLNVRSSTARSDTARPHESINQSARSLMERPPLLAPPSSNSQFGSTRRPGIVPTVDRNPLYQPLAGRPSVGQARLPRPAMVLNTTRPPFHHAQQPTLPLTYTPVSPFEHRPPAQYPIPYDLMLHVPPTRHLPPNTYLPPSAINRRWYGRPFCIDPYGMPQGVPYRPAYRQHTPSHHFAPMIYQQPVPFSPGFSVNVAGPAQPPQPLPIAARASTEGAIVSYTSSFPFQRSAAAAPSVPQDVTYDQPPDGQTHASGSRYQAWRPGE